MSSHHRSRHYLIFLWSHKFSISITAVFLILFLALTIGNPDSSSFTSLSDKAIISEQDFEYQGVVKIMGMGQSTQGLAYRPETNTYFTVGYNGRDEDNRYYNLFEFSMPTPSINYTTALESTVVRNWGPLNKNGILDIPGSLRMMKGLFWDNIKQRLWFTYGAYYAGSNSPVLGYVTFENNQTNVHGPWKLPSAVSSETAKGMIIEAPQSIVDINNRRFLMFGLRGSAAQAQSWGTGLVSVAEPTDDLPAGSELDGARIIHWPMKSSSVTGAYSDFPRLPNDHVKIIIGNDLVGAQEIGVAQGGGTNSIIINNTFIALNGTIKEIFYPTNLQLNHRSPVGWYVKNKSTNEQIKITSWDYPTATLTLASNWTMGIPTIGTAYELYYPTYETNNIITPTSVYREADNISHGAWIDLPDKHGLLYFGYTAIGYAWYGNESAHRDSTPDGLNNNIDSLYYPNSKVKDPERVGIKGRHAEYFAPRWYVLDPDFVIETARKVHNATAQNTDLEIPWSTAGDVLTLGGNVQLSYASFSEIHWNPETRLLYVLNPEGSSVRSAIVNVWRIKTGRSSTTTSTTLFTTTSTTLAPATTTSSTTLSTSTTSTTTLTTTTTLPTEIFPEKPQPIQITLRTEISSKNFNRIILSGEINLNRNKISIQNKTINVSCHAQGKKKKYNRSIKTNKNGAFLFNENMKKILNMNCFAKATLNKKNYFSPNIKITARSN